MNEQGKNVEEFQSTCPARGTTGKSGLSEYIKREVANGNLVRIKKRSPVNSESPAPTAVDYNDVTSQANAANKSAMAFGNNSIRSSSENSNTKIKKSERDVAIKRGARRAAPKYSRSYLGLPLSENVCLNRMQTMQQPKKSGAMRQRSAFQSTCPARGTTNDVVQPA